MTAYTLAYVAAAHTMSTGITSAQLDAAAARLLRAGDAHDADDAMIQACIDTVAAAHAHRRNDALGEFSEAVAAELRRL